MSLMTCKLLFQVQSIKTTKLLKKWLNRELEKINRELGDPYKGA